jgi:serine protease Do
MANKNKIMNSKELVAFVKSRKIGEKVYFTVIRNGEKKIIKVVLGSKNGFSGYKNSVKNENELGDKVLGMDLYEENGKVIVENVEKNSDAYYQGIKEGDVLVKANGEKITSINKFKKIVKKLKKRGKDSIFLVVENEGFNKYLILKLD